MTPSPLLIKIAEGVSKMYPDCYKTRAMDLSVSFSFMGYSDSIFVGGGKNVTNYVITFMVIPVHNSTEASGSYLVDLNQLN